MRTGRHTPASHYNHVTLAQIAREIDRTPTETRKVIRRAARLGIVRAIPRKRGEPHRYEANTVDIIKAMLEIPHRPFPEPNDWLTTYLNGGPKA